MYRIEGTEYGFRITFEGLILPGEMARWAAFSKRAVMEHSPGFGVIIDARSLYPLADEVMELLAGGQRAFRDADMSRLVVLVSDPVVAEQFRNVAALVGIAEGARYLDTSSTPNWQQAAMDWIELGIEPHKRIGLPRTAVGTKDILTLRRLAARRID